MTHSATNGDLQTLYRDLILEHARSPRNFGRLENATHKSEGINPLCGDKLSLYLAVDDNNALTNIGFEGSGCAISIASASLMTEAVCQLSLVDADECALSMTARLTDASRDCPDHLQQRLRNLRALDNVRDYPTRIKCATLAWQALHAALNQSPTIATTE